MVGPMMRTTPSKWALPGGVSPSPSESGQNGVFPWFDRAFGLFWLCPLPIKQDADRSPEQVARASCEEEAECEDDSPCSARAPPEGEVGSRSSQGSSVSGGDRPVGAGPRAYEHQCREPVRPQQSSLHAASRPCGCRGGSCDAARVAWSGRCSRGDTPCSVANKWTRYLKRFVRRRGG